MSGHRSMDLTGQTYGRLTAIEMGEVRGGRRTWLCLCSCGATHTASAGDLRKGCTRSCGCLRSELVSARRKGRTIPQDIPACLRARFVCDPETECHLWRGALDENGYGRLWITEVDRYRPAHVVAWELEFGPVPDGLELDHLCRVRSCCNSAHLEPVTHRENCLRGVGFAAINALKTHCDSGHAFDEPNTIWRGVTRQCRTCMARWKRDYRARLRARSEERRAA